LADTRQKINSARIALFGNTMIAYRTMFEIGLCAGAISPVDVIVGQVQNSEDSSDSTGWLPRFATVSQQGDDEDYSRFTAEIRAVVEQLMSEPSDFSNVALTGVSLSPVRHSVRRVGSVRQFVLPSVALSGCLFDGLTGDASLQLPSQN
jgi:hypothetical protein